MYCGLLIQNMRATLHDAGLPYATTPGALVGVVQLYHALRQEGLLADDCVWEDLQTLWTLQGDASFFVGNLPKTSEAYLKNYSLSIGLSVTHWAAEQSRCKTKHKVKTYSDNRRNLKRFGHLSRLVNLCLEHVGARSPWSMDAIQEAPKTGFAERYTDSRSHLRPEFKAKVAEAKAQYAALTPAGLIREVAEAIVHEKPELLFNFFTMHNEAWLFLERLKTTLNERFGYAAFLRALRGAKMLPLMPGVCLAAAAGQLRDRTQIVPASDTYLYAAADVMQKFVDERHGRRMRDVAERDVKPREVQALKQGLDLWALDVKGYPESNQEVARGGGLQEEGDMDAEELLQSIATDLQTNPHWNSAEGMQELQRMVQMLQSNPEADVSFPIGRR